MTTKSLISTDTDNRLYEVGTDLLELHSAEDISKINLLKLTTMLTNLATTILSDIQIFENSKDK